MTKLALLAPFFVAVSLLSGASLAANSAEGFSPADDDARYCVFVAEAGGYRCEEVIPTASLSEPVRDTFGKVKISFIPFDPSYPLPKK